MTRVAVDGVGYTEASTLLHDANQWAARYHGELRAGLAETGAMAGDSSFADGFATSYDKAARAATQAFDDLVTSCANLGRYAFASLENHTRAELASTFGGTVVTDQPSMLGRDWCDVAPIQVPSALGGDPSSLPGWANAILDHVEGFVWPDADLDRLAAAGTTWRTAAGHLELVASHADRAVPWLWEERSPEIPLAADAITDLASATRDLAAECTALGASCDDYARAVREQRDAILDLVHDLLRDAVLIQVGGAVLTGVTAGFSNAGAAGLNVLKIGAEAPRFLRMLNALRLYAAGAALRLESTATAVTSARLRLARFVEARAVLRGEAGSFQLGRNTDRGTSFLERHEGGPMRAHAIEKHVGKSDDYLRARLAAEGKRAVSTFADERSRTIAAGHALTEHRVAGQIAGLRSSSARRALPIESHDSSGLWGGSC